MEHGLGLGSRRAAGLLWGEALWLGQRGAVGSGRLAMTAESCRGAAVAALRLCLVEVARCRVCPTLC